MCDELLEDGVGLAQIAQTLWYSDQAAFTRAETCSIGGTRAIGLKRPE